MSKRMNFDLGFGPRGLPPREDGAPMRLLLLGDFSGRPASERLPLPTRPTLRVDVDDLPKVMARIAPRVTVPDIGEMRFDSVDEFHPDALLARLELFAALRAARSQPPPGPDSGPDSGSAGGGESPLAALLGGTPAGLASAALGQSQRTGLDALIHAIVAPHIVPDRLAETRNYVAAVDAAIAEQMRRLLHDPGFQAREAAWRGVQWLVSNLELDDTLQLHLFDVSREELLADIAGADGEIGRTALHEALSRRARSQSDADRGWSAMIGLYRFGPADADVELLTALGIVAAQAGAPFLAEGDPALSPKDAAPGVLDNWHALRTLEVAPWIGLVAPRLMLRRPYGAREERIDAFAFEELGNQPAHAHYLWGSGALACALLLGRAYRSAEGWQFSPGDQRDIDDLPSATRLGSDGEPELVPSAERFLADHEAERLLDDGLMPLLSHRHLNAVQLMRFQSIAKPSAPLAGLPA